MIRQRVSPRVRRRTPGRVVGVVLSAALSTVTRPGLLVSSASSSYENSDSSRRTAGTGSAEPEGSAAQPIASPFHGHADHPARPGNYRKTKRLAWGKLAG